MSTIKGITIEIDGQTTGLQRALRDVNGETRGIQGELRKVDKLLKFNPKNVELLRQQKQLLGEQVGKTKEKLDQLRRAQEQVEQQFQRGEIGVDQYRAFQRELITTEGQLDHYERRLREVDASQRSFADNMAHHGERFKEFGGKLTDVGQNMSLKVTAPIVGIGTAVTMMGIEFEAQMSKVSAISGATGDDFKALEDKAMELGSKTKFSATQVAEALEYTSLAGWDTKESLDGIDGILDLAAASGMDLGRTSDIVTDSLSMFGMGAEETGRMVDVLARVSKESNTDVDQLGEALKYVGANANALKIPIETTSAVLGILADNGLKGSSAGTTMNAMLRDMTSKAKDGALAFGDTNVALYDAQGNFRDITDIIADVEEATKDMNDEVKTDALRKYFGDESLKGVNILLGAGADAVKDLDGKLKDASGTAKEMSETMSDNLQGSIDGMKSAFEGLAIQIYKAIVPALRFVMDALQGLFSFLSKTPKSVLVVIAIIAAVVAAIGPLLIIIGMVISAVGSIMTAVSTLMPILLGLNPVVLAVIAGIALFVGALMLAWKHSEKFRDIVKGAFEAVKQAVTSVMTAISDFIQEVWGKITDFWNENGEQIKQATENVWNVIKGIFETILPFIQAIFKVQFELIKIIVETVWETIKSVIDGVLNVILGLVKTFSSLFTGDWKGVWEGIKQVTSGIGTLISEWIQTMFFGKLIKAVGKFVKPFAEYIKNMWNAIKGATESITNGIKTYINTVWSAIKAIVEGVMKGIKGIIDTVWGAIKGVITTVTGSIKGTVETAWNAIKSTTTTVWNAVKSAMVKPIESARDTIKGIVDKIKGFFSSMKLRIPKIEMPKLPRFTLTGQFSLKPPSVPKIGVSWNAKGGIFSNPTIFNTANAGLQGVGEAGAEAIIPLNAKTLGGIGKGIADQMNINGNQTIHIEPAPIFLDGRVIGEAVFETVDTNMGNTQALKAYMKGV